MSDAIPTPIDLPPHVAASDEWKAWPRKVDAHLAYGVRARQVQAFARSGRLKVYSCPDGTLRMDPEALRDEFGAPGEVQGRDRDLPRAERERKRRGLSDVDVSDPLAYMFRETASMLRETHAELLAIVKSIGGPVESLLGAYERRHKLMSDRIELLERNADEAAILRSELADSKHERELSADRHKQSERRRDQTLTLLKEQVPSLVSMYVDGSSLAAFVKRTPRAVIEALLEDGDLAPSDAEQIRRAAGIQPPQSTPPNGVSNHGHS